MDADVGLEVGQKLEEFLLGWAMNLAAMIVGNDDEFLRGHAG
jgi:hypothetical protein